MSPQGPKQDNSTKQLHSSSPRFMSPVPHPNAHTVIELSLTAVSWQHQAELNILAI